MPCPQRLRNSLIPAFYEERKAKLMTKLTECTALTIILDIWSSKNMLGFIGFSCQGVSSNFDPFNSFLTLTQMKGSHTAQAIVAEYEHVIEKWNLPVSKVNVLFEFLMKE